jgi:hypothetical protein
MTVVTLLLAWLAGTGMAAPVFAQGDEPATNRAGLVVVFDDGSVANRCVGFGEESISGYDLLVHGGFAPRSEVTSMGASICSLDGQGCGEGEDCFCQCLSSPCIYWTYWQQLPEGWRYSNAGPATVQVRDGDVQGWVWGESRPNAAAESAPPELTFADICAADAVLYGADGTFSATPAANTTQGWLVALVVGAPLLAGAGWWLLQRRKVVQP